MRALLLASSFVCGRNAGHAIRVRLYRAPGTPSQVCGSSRRLQPHAGRLLRDLLAVAAGLRAAAMLDYAMLDPQLLARLVTALVADLAPAGLVPGAPAAAAGGSERWVVAVLDGCCYVVRPVLLQELLIRTDSPQPQLLSFQSPARGGGMVPAWAGAAAAAATLVGQVGRLAEALQRRGGATAAGEAGGGQLVAVVDLDELASCEPGLGPLPPMPTLSGLLLGYPAVYAVHDLEGAQAASRALSATSLCLYTAALQWRGSGCGSTGLLPSSGEEPLLSFSVPAGLAGEASWERACGAWLQQLRVRVAAAGAAGYPWAGVALHAQASPPRGIAL